MLSGALPFVEFQRRLLGFTPTPGQRVYAKVAFDAIDPARLPVRERGIAEAIFGPVQQVPDSARPIIVMVKGRDAGATRLHAQRGVHLALTADLDLDEAEPAYVLLGGPKLRHGRIALRFARSEARRVPGVRIVDETRDAFVLLRSDGRRVKFEIFSAARGGDAGRGVPILFALLDEAAFFYDAATGVANDEDTFRALVPRLLDSGQIAIVSSPWAESGLLFSEFRSNHGQPSTALAAFCPTLAMRDDPQTAAMVARETRRDPANAARELGGQFLASGGGRFLGATELRDAVLAELQLGELPGPGVTAAVGLDVGLARDASAVVVCHQHADGGVRVADLLELQPTRERPLALPYVVAQACVLALRHGADRIMADQFVISEVSRLARPYGIRVVSAPGGAGGKARVYSKLRDLLREGRLLLPPGAESLLQQLSEVTSEPASGGGLSIRQPRRRGMHGDTASAAALAVWQLREHAGDNVARVLLRQHNKRADPERQRSDAAVLRAQIKAARAAGEVMDVSDDVTIIGTPGGPRVIRRDTSDPWTRMSTKLQDGARRRREKATKERAAKLSRHAGSDPGSDAAGMIFGVSLGGRR